MGQFKPMVKMMTTEPSVELKLKKGGTVKKPAKMMNGGVMGGLAAAPSAVGARGGMAPVARPGKPSMAAHRAAMKGAPMGRPAMMKDGGDTALEKHAAMPASKAHKGLKTGGVAMGQGGFKKGGAVPKSGILPVAESERGAKGYAKTKMTTAQGEHHTPKKTGDVAMGKPAGYKHGGKPKKMARGGMFGVEPGSRRAMSEIDPQFRANFAGPYEGYTPEPEYPDDDKYAKGGKAKKYAKGGGVEGNVSTSKPGVTNTKTGEVKLGNAGGYKKGGAPKKAFATGGSVNDSGRPVAYPSKPASKSVKNNLQSGTFKKGGGVKMNKGGVPPEIEDQLKTNEANRAYKNFRDMEKAENEAMRESILGAPKRAFESMKGLIKGMGAVTNKEREILEKSSPGSVTKTEKSVTVTPAKKRGGSVKKC